MALRIIIKDTNICYLDTLIQCKIKTLSEQRSDLCLKFAKTCIENEKSRDIFPMNDNASNTKVTEKFCVTKAKTDKLAKSDVPFMQRLLN